MTDSHIKRELSRSVRPVGRSDDLEQLAAALDKSSSGEGEVVSLTGEPGIGKTRLAGEFTLSAKRRGALSLWGRCARSGVPLFWPWIQITRAYLEAVDGDLAGELREIIEAFAAVTTHSESARFRFFDRVVATFRNLARNHPLILVFDDLQMIDDMSLALLAFAARQLSDTRVLILVLYREPEVSMSATSQSHWEALVSEVSRHLTIRHLTHLDIAQMIRYLAHRTPEPGLVGVLHRKTGGNPRLIETILRCDLIDWERGSIAERIPAEVRVAVEHHAATLSTATRQILTVASVIGLGFDVSTVQLAAARGIDEVLDAMAEGERAGVLRRPDPNGGQYYFAIELVRDVLCDGLSGASRDRLHVEIAEALETLYHRGSSVALEELAYHFAKGAAIGNADKAIEYGRRAASQALRRGAFHEAARLYALVLAAAKFVHQYDEAKCWDLLLALASSQSRSEDLLGARVSYQRAFEIAEGLGDPERVALAALGLSQVTKSSSLANQSLSTDHWSAADAENREPAAERDSREPSASHGRNGHNGAATISLPGTAAGRPPLYASAGGACVLEPAASATENTNPAEHSRPSALTETNKVLDRTFRREGEYWTISYEGKVIRIKDCKGLAFIAHLLVNPGREFHVTDMVAFSNHGPGNAVNRNGIHHLVRGGLGDAGPALDAASKSSYRLRLQELREELNDATSMGDFGKTEKIQEEIAFLSQELARAVGLGGRDRKMSSEAERARLRVTNVIRSAIQKVGQHHPALGRYLAVSLRTGSICSFENHAGSPGAWQL